MATFEEVPTHLQTHKAPTEEKQEAPQTEGPIAGSEVPTESIPATEALPKIAPEDRLLTPATAGESLGAMTGAGALAAQKMHALYKVLGDKFGKPSLQTYANSQIGDRYNVPLKDLQQLANMEHPITTQSMVQDAAARLKGSPEIPARRESILDPQGVHRGWRQIPRTEAIPPVDLSMYEKPTGVKGVVQGTIKQGAVPIKAGLAGYDIGAGLENISRGDTGLGALQTAAGAAMGASATPFLKGKAKTLATGIGALPIVGHALNSAIGTAEAAPMTREEKALSAADIATSLVPGPVGVALGLMKPTELGSEDVYRGRQGTNPLKGTGSVMEHYVPRKAKGGKVPAPYEEYMQKMIARGLVKTKNKG